MILFIGCHIHSQEEENSLWFKKRSIGNIDSIGVIDAIIDAADAIDAIVAIELTNGSINAIQILK